jgi:DNA-binding response OmpR family regulator
MNILVVDDEPSQCRTLSMGLRSEGFFVYQATSAVEAIRIVGMQPIDVAIVDIMMPGTSGFELGRRLRETYPAIKVILVSAHHISERQITRSRTGAVAFLPKPYSLERLVSFLQERLPESTDTDPEVI